MSSTKNHITLPYHFFKSKAIILGAKVLGINNDNQLVDQSTKGLLQDKFERDRFKIMGWSLMGGESCFVRDSRSMIHYLSLMKLRVSKRCII